MKDTNQVLRGLIAVAVLVIVIGAIIVFSEEDSQESNIASSSSSAAEASLPEPSPQVEGPGSFEDGSFETTTTYISPGGPAEMNIALTLEGDVVQSISVTSLEGNPTSQDYKERFANEVISFVTGVNLDEADVDTIAGASLTSRGFNEALDVIRSKFIELLQI